MRRLALGALLALAGGASAGDKAGPPELTQQHTHESGAFSFKTPPDWGVAPAAGRPDALDASSGSLIVRFLYSDRESGFDSLHVDCMLVRLAGAMEAQPQVKYEYDFLSGTQGSRRFLDSAFIVKYDAPVGGAAEWRQRNLTFSGGGDSLCVIAYAPLQVWRKDKAARAVLDAVVKSIAFRNP